MKSVLFICTGNTCRSAMAEGLFKDMLKKRKYLEEDIKVQSAGVFALEGDSANRDAIKAMQELGIDIGDHRAQRLTPSILREAEIVLAMTKNHRDAILSMEPSVADRTYTLAEYGIKFNKDLENIEITDPYGQPITAYRESIANMKMILESIVDQL